MTEQPFGTCSGYRELGSACFAQTNDPRGFCETCWERVPFDSRQRIEQLLAASFDPDLSGNRGVLSKAIQDASCEIFDSFDEVIGPARKALLDSARAQMQREERGHPRSHGAPPSEN